MQTNKSIILENAYKEMEINHMHVLDTNDLKPRLKIEMLPKFAAFGT